MSEFHCHDLLRQRVLTLTRNDPTPDRGSQLPWAAFLIVSSLPDLRTGLLKPDNVRGISLDLDQYYLECLGDPPMYAVSTLSLDF